ncbi:MAG: RNA polymerase sigma factor [Acidimicrobiia bacterium]
MADPPLTPPASDPDAVLADLFRAHHGPLVRTATLLLGDAGVAEEIVQDAYVKLHGALPRLRRPEAALAYLRTTVVNLARSRLRRYRVARRHPPLPPPPGPGAEEEAVVSEDHREVLVALDALPRRQRECLVLRFYLGLSEADIAAALSLSTGSVKTHTSRGLAALTARLEQRS